MLRKFRVSNFKSFEDNFELDLTRVKGYEFNTECIKENLVNSAIIYGYNGVGKSNLALAIFDIIEHLTDKEKSPYLYSHYLNARSNEKFATFYFEFLINSKIVSYEYKKADYKNIIFERLVIDNIEVVKLDRMETNLATIELEGAESLNREITSTELSVLKYIKSNSQLEDTEINKAFMGLLEFVDSMLFFKSLNNNTYLGYQVGRKNCLEDIIEKGRVEEFESFLNEAKVECKLRVVDDINSKTIAFDFGDKFLPFRIASTGTNALALFFYWYQTICENKVPFLFIDEFDAFYHNELSKLIVKKLKESGIQFILTSHNLSIMTNDLLRPDCYFSMNKGRVKSFSELTDKDLREAHNIEKMYKAKAFDV